MKPKPFFRLFVGLLAVFPAVLKVWILTPLWGREKAVKVCGPGLTAAAKLSLKLWIPEISTAAEFARFPSKMKARFWLWKPLFDIAVVEEDQNKLKLNITNCPFCEALLKLGCPELGPYVCQGDVEMARDNADRWAFERNYQIGTGDLYCDHTYLRRDLE
jgi:hypothetical protein